MRTIVHRPPKHGRRTFAALCGLLAGALLAAPVQAAEYNRPWFLGMGDARCAGGLVDVPTGAVQLRFPLPKLPGRLGHALAWHYTGQDGTGGPMGVGTALSGTVRLVSAYSGGYDLVMPGGRRFKFLYEYDWTIGAYAWVNWRDPEMLGARYTETGAGGLTGTLQLKNGDQLRFTDGVLAQMRDRHGNWLSFDTTGWNLVAIRWTSSSWYPWVKFTYGAAGVTKIRYEYNSVSDPLNREWNITYDGNGRISTITDPLNGVTQYTWTTYTRAHDGQVLPLVASITNPRGHALLFQYDTQGRCTRLEAADAGVTTISYSSAPGTDGTTTVTDPRGNVTSWSYVWPAASLGTQKYGYRLTSMTDPLGRLTTYQATISGSQLINRITDFQNRVTTLGWDTMKGNLTSVTKPTTSGGTVTTNATYEGSCSHCTSVTDPLGRQATATVDDVTKNIVQTRTPRFHTSSYTYDSLTGDVTSVSFPNGDSHFIEYDYYGNLSRLAVGGVNRGIFVTDAAGRRTSATDANGKVTTYVWDRLDRLVSVTRTLSGQPVVTQFEYDANSNRKALIDPLGRRWEWSFDSMDRVMQDKNPLLQTRSYEWDKNANMTARVDRKGQRAEFVYGTGDRLELERYKRADSSIEATVTYSYSPTTKLLQSVTDSEYGTITPGYDNLDRLTSRATPQGTITYTLDNLGRRTGMQAPGQGAITYGFDNNDNITSIAQSGQTTSLEYDSLDRLIRRTLPTSPAVATEWVFNSQGYLNLVKSLKGGVQFDHRLYERDWMGTLGRETINGQVKEYGHDDLYRLIWATAGGVTSSWSYDKVGNRLTQAVGGATTTYTHNSANRLLTVNGASVTHDLNGSLTAFAGATYTWDTRNRLRTLVKSGATYTFGYNPEGLRTSKAVGGATTSFLLDGDSIVSEIATSGTTHLLQSPFTDQPLKRGDKWFVPEKVNSTALLVNGSGTTTQSYDYKPFGQLNGTPTDPNPFQFTGRENDGNTGLMYYRARYYAPEWGRFVSEDPIGFEGGINQYAYVENSPLNWVDPDGLAQRPSGWKLFVMSLRAALGLANASVQDPGMPSGPPGRPVNWPTKISAPMKGPGPGPGPGPGGGGGSGGAAGAFGTIAVGAGAAADGINATVKYKNQRLRFLDGNGDWW